MTETPMESPMETQDGGKMNLIAIVGIILVVALVAFVMMRSNNATTPAEQTNVELIQQEVIIEEVIEEEAMEEEQGTIREFAVEGGSFYFEPSQMTVKLGDTVRITFNAVDDADMEHDFVIDEFDVSSATIAGGKSTTIEFIADRVGEFEYYCSVGEHRQLGMTGTLIVEE